ncbi:hypothetical protein HYV72_02710 [Candidatus Uhrbacteria bacterium]|nr:hypothetical protein [Candidatus Uhrbacteria bacterium]
MTIFERIQARLDEAGAAYHVSHHAPTRTSADASRIRNVPLHEGAKALVLRLSKSDTYILCVIPAHLRLDGKKVQALVGHRISFASDPETIVGCTPGSVPPYGSILGLKTYCDVRLKDTPTIHFNAGSLTDSITMSSDDYFKTEQPELVDITES